MEEKSIAYELLEEVKKTSKRLFIIAIVELVIIVSMAIGFLIYESQYEYSTTDELYQDITDSDVSNTNLNQRIGE